MSCLFLAVFVLVVDVGETNIKSNVLTILGATIGYFARVFDDAGAEDAQNKPK
jgi:hypothetical protein